MSVRLIAASSQYIQRPAIVTVLPVTFGFWLMTTTVATGVGVILTYGTVAQDYSFARDAAQWFINGGTARTNFGSAVINQWYFAVIRFISSTNKRAAILQPDGAVAHAANTNTTAITPTFYTIGIDAALSAGTYFDGLIGEYWMTDSDIQPDGAQISDSLVRTLAGYGPFHLPHVSARVVEYQSLQAGPDRSPGTWYANRYARAPWTTPGFSTGPHPPWASRYRTPAKNSPTMVIPI